MFKDRRDAGSRLADRLKDFAGQRNVLVLGLPRGGVVTAAEIARSLKAPLDVIIVRKIGHPLQPELAAGAISETGTVVYNEDVVSSWGITREYLRSEAAEQLAEVRRRQQRYRGGGKLVGLKGTIIILVDDGIATGATMKAAIGMLRLEAIEKLIVAVPVAPFDAATEVRGMVDVFIALDIPADFMSVGRCYLEFPQVSDEEVVRLLRDFRGQAAA